MLLGAQLTYLPVWLDARGLSADQIALALSAPMIVRIGVTPALAVMADWSQAYRAMILALCATVLGLLLVLSQAQTAWVVLTLVIGMSIASGSLMPFTETVTLAAVRHAGVDYGRTRLWGSITFILASYLAGYAVTAFGPDAIIWLMVAGISMTAMAALVLQTVPPDEGPRRSKRGLGDVRALLVERPFCLFIVCCGLVQASHALFYGFGVLHWRSQGYSAGFIGSLWALAVIAEIILFWAARHVAVVSAVGLIGVGALAAVLRWGMMAFDPPSVVLVALQILHAGSFAATHLGAMRWIGQHVPAHQVGTAQALLATVTSGFAMSVALMASGPLYASVGAGGYLAMAAVAGVGLAMALGLWRSAAR